MAGIIKVNQYQDFNGNTLFTSDGSGNITPGSLNIADAQIASNAAISTTKLGTGAVLQVKQQAFSNLSTTSTSYASIGSLSITPNSASNKILITTLNHIYVNSYSTDTWRGAFQKVLRDSTELLSDGTGGYGEGAFFVGNSDRYMCYSSLHYLDSPNSTSAVTYDMQVRSRVSGVNVNFNNSSYGSGGRMILMEIAG